MIKETDKAKMKGFIARLEQNPCFKNLTPLKVEEQISLFFVQNISALRTTLSSASFFPALSWEEIQKLFFDTLLTITNNKINPLLKMICTTKINFEFMNKLLNRGIQKTQFSNQLYEFLIQIISRFEIRKGLEPVLKIISYDVMSKYVAEMFRKRSYIAFEIDKVQKLRIEENFMPDYVNLMLLLSIIGQVRSDDNSLNVLQKFAQKEIQFSNLAIQRNFYKKLVDNYSKTLTLFPPNILMDAVNSHLSFIDDPNIPATSRLAKIFYIFGKSYKYAVKIDRGAESYEKSWLQTQRKNYKYFGFDNKMLDELYRIAAENYW